MDGWIKLHRKITEWEWYTDTNTFRVFIHCLLLANHDDIKWRGKIIKRGSLVTSYSKLAAQLKLTPKQTRTAIEKLKASQNLASEWHSQYSIISIENYNLYQTTGQAEGRQRASSCYNKNERREEESDNRTTNNVVSLTSSLYKPLGVYSNVYLSKEQYGTLTQLMGGEKMLSTLIDELSENIASKRDAVFDEKYPKMHFIRLRKYFKSHQNKPKGVLNDEPKPYNPYL